jgi:hypothetical protein
MKRQIASSVKAHVIRTAFYLLLLVSVSTIPFALGQWQARGQRTLTFAERVAYQRAIEDVYWRHRIWPKERPDAKPPLDAVMSQERLGKKVADYLRKSQALEDYWRRPITAEQLQTEMDRMAKRTKQPEVLRELFEARGNDPLVVAECLARPVLSERLTADFSVQDKTGCFESARIKGLRSVSIATTAGNAAYNLPTISEGDPPCTDDTWTATSTTDAPSARQYHTAVWTGSEMIVWGGYFFDGSAHYLNTGGRYDPTTDSWTGTSTTNTPTGREYHTAVWTGNEMVVWGGYDGSSYLNTGGRYNPGTDNWIATSTNDAPTARYFHTPVWTGSEMIVWGGLYTNYTVNTGGRYNPGTDSWTATSTTNAPSARYLHTAVWTGSEMIVWGGASIPVGGYLNTGGRYDSGTDSWIATSTTSAPTPRFLHTTVWTGSEMIIWGGATTDNSNDGGRYNPSTDAWMFTTTTNAPDHRSSHSAVWTGTEMIVWGGAIEGNNGVASTGGRYCAQSGPTPTPTPRVTTRPRPTPHPRP